MCGPVDGLERRDRDWQEIDMNKSKTNTASITREIARLKRLSTPELAAEYERLHGAPPRSRNHRFLWRRCAWKVQERAFGGLSKAAKTKLDELIANIAIPERPSRTAVESVIGRGRGRPRRSESHDLPTSPVRPRPALPPPGTTIVRRWRDRDLRLTFLDDGVDVDGAFYPSLTAAAREITGSKWNGRLFWLGKNGGR